MQFECANPSPHFSLARFWTAGIRVEPPTKITCEVEMGSHESMRKAKSIKSNGCGCTSGFLEWINVDFRCSGMIEILSSHPPKINTNQNHGQPCLLQISRPYPRVLPDLFRQIYQRISWLLKDMYATCPLMPLF